MTFTIEGELCDLNTYINAERSNRHRAAKIKREETERVAWAAIQAKCPAVASYPVHITFTWYSPNKRKDVDNIAFAVKFILDGLVEAGVLEDDSRKFVSGFSHMGFFVDAENPRVEVSIVRAAQPSTSANNRTRR